MRQRLPRRRFLEWMGVAASAPLLPGVHPGLTDVSETDVTLRIAPIDLEIAPGKIVKTTAYNGQAPGPFLRFREGQQVTVEVINESKEPEIVHWHGLFLAPDVD